MELTKDQKTEIINDQLLLLEKAYYGLQVTAQACRDSGASEQAEAAKGQMESLIKRKDSLKKQLGELDAT